MKIGGVLDIVRAILRWSFFLLVCTPIPQRRRITLDAEAEDRQAGEEHRHAGYALGRQRRVRLIQEDPDARSQLLPRGQGVAVIFLLEAERPRDFLVAEPLALDVELIEDCQGGLRVPVHAVRTPAARLYLRGKST